MYENIIFFKKNEQNKEEIYFIKKAVLLLNTITFYMKMIILEMVSFAFKYRIAYIFVTFYHCLMLKSYHGMQVFEE